MDMEIPLNNHNLYANNPSAKIANLFDKEFLGF